MIFLPLCIKTYTQTRYDMLPNIKPHSLVLGFILSTLSLFP